MKELIYLIILVVCFFPNTGYSLDRKGKPGKFVIIFIDPKVKSSTIQMAAMKIPLEMDIKWYERNGYNWVIRDSSRDDIAKFILNPRVKSVAFYGHGSSTEPTFGDFTSNGWQQIIKNKIKEQLLKKGYNRKNAEAIAYQSSMNFDLQDVINRGCGSLKNPNIANRFVRRGEKYYGCKASKYAPMSPKAWVYSDVDCMIGEHTSAGTITPERRKVHCKGHLLYCKQRGTVYSYPKTAIDKNLDGKCDKCGLPYMLQGKLAPGLRGAQRGDVWCRDTPNF
ncbi:hypothetical protein JWG39_11180 [Desulforhopalus vacuolatus]|uniref:hypothetical protein n=1 Tax=Desulforhopalus vacuolatus TaxID=40414 RepID=UPI00196407A7|nr:hypothetical protein [Desulforhopalus vacuolatus]MBM9520374.1 hypothetical protein [Desulforhopalus vacuolatus]